MSELTDTPEDIAAMIEARAAQAPEGHSLFVVTIPDAVDLQRVLDQLPTVVTTLAALGYAAIILPKQDGTLRFGFYVADAELESWTETCDNKAMKEVDGSFLEKAVETGNPEVTRVRGLQIMEGVSELGMKALGVLAAEEG